MEEKPVKQFYNRKTKKWHVYFKNSESGDVRIKQVNNTKMPDVKVIGNHRPDGKELAENLYSEPHQKVISKVEIEMPKSVEENMKKDEPKNDQETKPKDESKTKDSSIGFFDFL